MHLSRIRLNCHCQLNFIPIPNIFQVIGMHLWLPWLNLHYVLPYSGHTLLFFFFPKLGILSPSTTLYFALMTFLHRSCFSIPIPFLHHHFKKQWFIHFFDACYTQTTTLLILSDFVSKLPCESFSSSLNLPTISFFFFGALKCLNVRNY